MNFRDSYLLIPDKLKELCKHFEILDKKDIFPLKFISITNLHYKGPVPSKEMFFDISAQEYEDYVRRFEGENWDIMKELEKYCEMDCISLYNVFKDTQQFPKAHGKRSVYSNYVI